MVVVLIGINGPAMVLSAETAYYLEKLCKVAALRQKLRDGRHQHVSQELLELRHLAMSVDPAMLPSQTEDGSSETEAATDSDVWLSPGQVADLLGITDSAVRIACRDGRIDAEQVGAGRRWRISREAFEDFRDNRVA